jgi:hypothetical protein
MTQLLDNVAIVVVAMPNSALQRCEDGEYSGCGRCVYGVCMV